MKKYYITGISGAGKTTVAKELSKKGFAHFDIDDVEGLCYWINKVTKENVGNRAGTGRSFVEEHKWIVDIKKMKTLLNSYKEDLVVSGVCANQDDFLNLFDKVFLLHCSEETFIHRLNTREDDRFGKDPGQQEGVINWYKSFEKRMKDLGAIAISSEGEIDKVVNKTLSHIN